VADVPPSPAVVLIIRSLFFVALAFLKTRRQLAIEILALRHALVHSSGPVLDLSTPVVRENPVRRKNVGVSGWSRMPRPMRLFVCLLAWFLRAVLTSRRHLALENLALRQQLATYARRDKRPRLKPEERVLKTSSTAKSLWSLHERTSVPTRVEPHPRRALRRSRLLENAPPGCVGA
jgi:hypothetical protein